VRAYVRNLGMEVVVLPDMVAGEDDDPDACFVPEEHEFGVVRAVSVRQRSKRVNLATRTHQHGS
jgi:endo-1,4-beta-mannosidase